MPLGGSLTMVVTDLRFSITVLRIQCFRLGFIALPLIKASLLLDRYSIGSAGLWHFLIIILRLLRSCDPVIYGMLTFLDSFEELVHEILGQLISNHSGCHSCVHMFECRATTYSYHMLSGGPLLFYVTPSRLVLHASLLLD